MIGSGKKQKISADEQAERFEALVQLSTKAGYIHYEISNLAMPGKESKHNSAYWEGKPYLGFGPSAHSFSGTKIFFFLTCKSGLLVVTSKTQQMARQASTKNIPEKWNPFCAARNSN
jgi:coproporphyrinogen III oxidase-like Fe-S oxidoreductase